MKVGNIRIENGENGKVRLCADATWGGTELPTERHTIWYEYPHNCMINVDNAGNVYLAALLFPAMKLGEDLTIEAPVSARLLSSVEQIMDIFCSWYPNLHRVKIFSDGNCDANLDVNPSVATFFSGGVDSFYMLLKHKDEIDSLLLVHGFDIKLHDIEGFERAIKRIQQVANEMAKKIVPVATNVGEFVNRYVDFGTTSHGTLLASIGLGLGEKYAKIYIPSSFFYASLFPWGSHPLVDPLWSTESTSFVHEGCEATRASKVMAIAKSPVALKTLRVCHADVPGRYNCGRCEKCIRTMIALRIAGVRDTAAIFSEELTLDAVRKLQVANARDRIFLQENIDQLRKLGTDEPLLAALEMCKKRTDPTSLMFKTKRLIHKVDDTLLAGQIKKILNRHYAT